MKKHQINSTTAIYLFPIYCTVSFKQAIAQLSKIGKVTVLTTFKSNLALQLETL